MNSTEKYGTDVETAVQLAIEELGVGIDDVEVEVLDEPTKGFLGTGLGRKLAFVRVTKKVPDEPEEKSEKANNLKAHKSKVAPKNQAPKAKASKQKKEEKPEKVEKNYEEEIKKLEHVTPIVDKDALNDLGENEGLTFLIGMMKSMNLDVNVKGKTDGKDVFFFVEGKDTGTVIGKRGATLDAIQYLTSLVINKGGGEYKRVVVDAESYRIKREKTLEKLAMRMADRVARSGRSFKLEPMNPYERKVIHATLQKDGRVVTRSEGQDPSRRVIIDIK